MKSFKFLLFFLYFLFFLSSNSLPSDSFQERLKKLKNKFSFLNKNKKLFLLLGGGSVVFYFIYKVIQEKKKKDAEKEKEEQAERELLEKEKEEKKKKDAEKKKLKEELNNKVPEIPLDLTHSIDIFTEKLYEDEDFLKKQDRFTFENKLLKIDLDLLDKLKTEFIENTELKNNREELEVSLSEKFNEKIKVYNPWQSKKEEVEVNNQKKIISEKYEEGMIKYNFIIKGSKENNDPDIQKYKEKMKEELEEKLNKKKKDIEDKIKYNSENGSIIINLIKEFGSLFIDCNQITIGVLQNKEVKEKNNIKELKNTGMYSHIVCKKEEERESVKTKSALNDKKKALVMDLRKILFKRDKSQIEKVKDIINKNITSQEFGEINEIKIRSKKNELLKTVDKISYV